MLHWTRRLIHDHTPYFRSPNALEVGDELRLRLRAPTDAPIREARLTVLEHGEPCGQGMRELEPRGPWRDFEATVRLHAPTVRYCFVLLTGRDTVQLTTRGARRYAAAHRDWFQVVAGPPNPAWLEDRVFYQVFVDRFRNGDAGNDVREGEYAYAGRPVRRREWHELPTRAGDVHEHYGGDLDGVREALPYLAELGVNGLYLTPVFASPSNHRYDTSDYLAVDPHLGGEPALRRLLDAARERGVRVVLDGVFNHSGNQLPQFQRALAGGPERQLFSFGPDGAYEAFFGVRTLPKIDYASEAALEAFLEGEASPLRYWTRYGIDGWRLDVAHMIGAGGTDARNLEVLRRLRAAVRHENPHAWVFGERFYDAETALQGPDRAAGRAGGGEDGVMNYQGFALPVMDWFSGRRIWDTPVRLPTPELAEVMLDTWRVLPAQRAAAQYNLLGSHDIPRALHRLGGNAGLLRQALALLFAFPGVPGLYYGDEIGMSGSGIPFNRGPFPWDESAWDLELLADVRALVRARRDTRALRSGSLVVLHARGNALAIARPYTTEDGRTEAAVCAVSRSGTGQVDLDLAPAGIQQGVWQDALTGNTVRSGGGRLRLDLSRPKVLAPLPDAPPGAKV